MRESSHRDGRPNLTPLDRSRNGNLYYNNKKKININIKE